jgi:hypothetical protein
MDFYLWGQLKFPYSSPADNMEALRNRIVAGFQAIRNMPGIWDSLWVAKICGDETCIQEGSGHIEHLLYGNMKG